MQQGDNTKKRNSTYYSTPTGIAGGAWDIVKDGPLCDIGIAIGQLMHGYVSG